MMTQNLQIQPFDFYHDWANIARARLTRSGFATSHPTDDVEASRAYFNALMHLTIPAQPRRVLRASSLVCPPALQAGLAQFEAKISGGQSLRPHMSRGTKKLATRDGMRYDWGIHHFHLGTVLESDGFVARTGPLLFALVKPDDFYVIGIYEHGAWYEQEILKTVYADWPELLEPYRISSNAVALEQDVTDEEIKRVRNAHGNVFLQVAPGFFITNPGGGQMASGHSMDVVRTEIEWHETLNKRENQLTVDSPDLQEVIAEIHNINPILRFTLVEKQEALYIVEANNRFRWPIENPWNLPALA